MSKLEHIKFAAAELSPEEQAALRAWLDELAEQRWDEQIERDDRAGKFDGLVAEALDDLKEGRVRDL